MENVNAEVLKFIQSSPPYVLLAIVGYFALKWGFSFLRESVTALVQLGREYLSTINGYFGALSVNNNLIQKAITESGTSHAAALEKVTASNALTGTNLEKLTLIVNTQAATLEATAKLTSENAKKLLDTIQERADELKKQGEMLSTSMTTNAESQALGFNQMRDILNAIDTKLDSNSTTLVNQIVAQFKPAFDEQLEVSKKLGMLAQQVGDVQVLVDKSARQLESTFLTAIGQIVNNATRPAGDIVNPIAPNGEVNHAGA